MAFTGAATIIRVSDRAFRITGLSLGIGAAGTISLAANAAGEVEITAPDWDPRRTTGTHGGVVTLADAIKITVIEADAAGTMTETVAVTKAGTLPADFIATLTNKDIAASGALEIYVEYLG